jgi:hypothetical protein
MSSSRLPVVSKSPEQEEVDAKKIQFDQLETEYATWQLEHTTLSEEIASFRNRYYLRVGGMYARLDALRAQVRDLLSALDPSDELAQEEAHKAKEKAKATSEEAGTVEEEGSTAFEPSEELRALYRRAAKLIHPDRAKDEQDRLLRTRLFADVNQAYKAGNDDTIAEIIERYQAQLDIPENDDIGVRLVRLIRMIAKTKDRINELKRGISTLRSSDMFKLKTEVEEGESSGSDPLGKLAEKLHAAILEEQARLSELEKSLVAKQRSDELVAATVPKPKTPQAKKPKSGSKRKKPKPSPVEKPGADASSFWPAGLVHRTERGEMVRSKSEAIIANILFHVGLDYRYEYPIEGVNRPGIRRPDFVFLDADHQPIVWEHLGMLSDHDYSDRWQAKKEWYEANGFREGMNLFVTQDDEGTGLDSREIRSLAELIRDRLKP